MKYITCNNCVCSKAALINGEMVTICARSPPVSMTIRSSDGGVGVITLQPQINVDSNGCFSGEKMPKISFS